MRAKHHERRIGRLAARYVTAMALLSVNLVCLASVSWGRADCPYYCTKYFTWTPSGGAEDAVLIPPGYGCSTAYGFRNIGLVIKGTKTPASDFFGQGFFGGANYFCNTAQAMAGLTEHGISSIGSIYDGDRKRIVCLAGSWAGDYITFKPESDYCFSLETPTTCSITATSLAHGDLALTGVNGDVASASAKVQCSGATTATVRAVASGSSTVPVRPDGTITSRLTVNGSDGSTGASIVVPANQSVNVTVASTLKSSQPTEGALLGSATLIVDTQ